MMLSEVERERWCEHRNITQRKSDAYMQRGRVIKRGYSRKEVGVVLSAIESYKLRYFRVNSLTRFIPEEFLRVNQRLVVHVLWLLEKKGFVEIYNRSSSHCNTYRRLFDPVVDRNRILRVVCR